MQTTRLLLLLAGSLPFNALALDGLQFHHEDWGLTCDNTGTCCAVSPAQQAGQNPCDSVFDEDFSR